MDLNVKITRTYDLYAQLRVSSADAWELCGQSRHGQYGLLQTAAKRCIGHRRHRWQGVAERSKPRKLEIGATACACPVWGSGVFYDRTIGGLRLGPCVAHAHGGDAVSGDKVVGDASVVSRHLGPRLCPRIRQQGVWQSPENHSRASRSAARSRGLVRARGEKGVRAETRGQ